MADRSMSLGGRDCQAEDREKKAEERRTREETQKRKYEESKREEELRQKGAKKELDQFLPLWLGT